MTCVLDLSHCKNTYSYVLAEDKIAIVFDPTNEINANPAETKLAKEARIYGRDEWLFNLETLGSVFAPNALTSADWQCEIIGKDDKGNNILGKTCNLKPINSKQFLWAETVPFNQLKDTHNLMNRTHFIQMQDYYNILPPAGEYGVIDYFSGIYLSVRSAVIKLTTKGRVDENDMFGHPVQVSFKVDQVRIQGVLPEFASKQLCLGKLNTKTNNWTCSNRNKPKGLLLDTLKLSQMKFDVYQPGIYAIILRPIYAPKQKPDAYEGLLKLQKTPVICIIFLWLPIGVILMGLIGDVVEFEVKCKDIKDDRKFLREQVDRMGDVTADFVGQKLSEKIDEGIEYSINPVHASQGLDVKQVQEINLALEKIEEEKESMDSKRKKLFTKISTKNKKITELRSMIADLNEDEKFKKGIMITEEE